MRVDLLGFLMWVQILEPMPVLQTQNRMRFVTYLEPQIRQVSECL